MEITSNIHGKKKLIEIKLKNLDLYLKTFIPSTPKENHFLATSRIDMNHN
jgi:hypothetical protein